MTKIMKERKNKKRSILSKKQHLFEDFTGKIFRFLKVTKRFGFKLSKNGRKTIIWECVCICGKIRYCVTNELKSGISYSCGCKKYTNKHDNQQYDPIEAAYRAKASNYKANAHQRHIKWELTMEETIYLLKNNCFYCGVSPSNTYSLLRNRKNKYLILSEAIREKHKLIYYSGIDRMENIKGYTIENSVSCCKVCNTAKMQMSLEEFYAWIDRVVIQRRKNEISNH